MTMYQANERLAGDLKLVMRDTEDLLRATVGATSDKVGEVRRRLANALESAKATCQRLQNKTAEAAEATDWVIRRHPYESLGIALGAGILIGVVVRRS